MISAQDCKGTEKTHAEPLRQGAGIIVIDKPRGPSSHQVAAWVGKMLGCQIGHAGTLDPKVSGILLIMLGNAVRLAPLLLKHDKEYVCLMRLHHEVDRRRIDEVAAEFTGMAAIVVAVFLMTTAQVKVKGKPRPVEELEQLPPE